MVELQTISKALDILMLLGKSQNNLSVEDISKHLDTPESTTYRLLQTLEKKGFVEHKSRSNIRLGYNILNLARNTYEKLDRELTLIATPVMQNLTDESGETTVLTIRSGLYYSELKSVPSKQSIRFVADKKRLMPLYRGASGKSILAFENQKVIDLVMQSISSLKTKNIICKELINIKNNGFSVSISEHDIGAFALAVPVYNSFNQIYASLAIIGPQFRINNDNYNSFLPSLLKASKTITEQLV